MQWRTVVGILLALLVAVFAVANVKEEPINYVFGTQYLPLVLIILGSALLGALAVFVPGFFGRLRMGQEIRRLRQELAESKRDASPETDQENKLEHPISQGLRHLGRKPADEAEPEDESEATSADENPINPQ